MLMEQRAKLGLQNDDEKSVGKNSECRLTQLSASDLRQIVILRMGYKNLWKITTAPRNWIQVRRISIWSHQSPR